MGRAPSHKTVRYGAKVSHKESVCSQQFPDCPEIPNYTDCHTCPLWGTGISSAYKEKEINQEASNIA